MAQKIIAVTTCDKCGKDDDSAVRYEIIQGARKRLIDLCQKDQAGIEALMEVGTTRTAGRPSTKPVRNSGTPRKGRGVKATTLEDIEAGKKKADK